MGVTMIMWLLRSAVIRTRWRSSSWATERWRFVMTAAKIRGFAQSGRPSVSPKGTATTLAGSGFGCHWPKRTERFVARIWYRCSWTEWGENACSSRRLPEAPATRGRGFAGILHEGLDGLSVGEVAAVPDDGPYRVGLGEAVSPLRLRGMVAMLSRIKRQVRVKSVA